MYGSTKGIVCVRVGLQWWMARPRGFGYVQEESMMNAHAHTHRLVQVKAKRDRQDTENMGELLVNRGARTCQTMIRHTHTLSGCSWLMCVCVTNVRGVSVADNERTSSLHMLLRVSNEYQTITRSVAYWLMVMGPSCMMCDTTHVLPHSSSECIVLFQHMCNVQRLSHSLSVAKAFR